MSRTKQAEYAMELKLAAVRRGRAGESVRAVAEELGIRRKRLYVWKDRYAELGEAGLARQRGGRPRKEAQEAGSPSETTVGRGELLAARKRIAELERKVGQQELELDFFGEALRRIKWARSDLHVDRGAGRARRPQRGTNVRVERRQPGGVLSALGIVGTTPGRHGAARCHPAGDRGKAVLRIPAGATGTAAARAMGECETRAAPDARRQSAQFAHAAVRACDHRFAAWMASVAESGAWVGNAQPQ